MDEQEWKALLWLVDKELGTVRRAFNACAKQNAINGTFVKALAKSQAQLEMMLSIKSHLVTIQYKQDTTS